MATTIVQDPKLVQAINVPVITITFTANGDVQFMAPDGLLAMGIQGLGSLGGGTCTLQVSNDGVNFVAAPTATTIPIGVVSTQVADLGFKFYNIHLTGSTSPTLTVIVALNYEPTLF